MNLEPYQWRPLWPVTCYYCRKPFEATGPRSKYCDACNPRRRLCTRCGNTYPDHRAHRCKEPNHAS